MKKRAVFCALCLALLLTPTLTGCGNEGKVNENDFGTESDASAPKIEENLTETGAETKTGGETETGILKAVPEFMGISDLKGKTGSSAVNNKECCYQAFCYDDKAVYFANPGDNQYLYSYDGKNLRLLTDMPVYCLNYRDGMIYFLSNGSPLNLLDLTTVKGYLYSYDILSEKLTRLTNFTVGNLFVSDRGILFLRETDGHEAVYKLDESTGESIYIYDCYSIMDYHGYYIYHTYGKERIDYFITDGCESYQLPIAGVSRNDCISDGKYYYRIQGERSLNIIDLTDGERFKIEVPNGKTFSDYTVFKGETYLLLGGYLFVYRDGELIKMNDEMQFRNIYVGKDCLYGLRENYAGNESMEYDFYKLVVEEDGVTAEKIT